MYYLVALSCRGGKGIFGAKLYYKSRLLLYRSVNGRDRVLFRDVGSKEIVAYFIGRIGSKSVLAFQGGKIACIFLLGGALDHSRA